MDEQEEKLLTLTETEMIKVLEEQVAALLKSCPNNEIHLPDLLASFMKFHGHSLHLLDYGVSTVADLIGLIPRIAKVSYCPR